MIHPSEDKEEVAIPQILVMKDPTFTAPTTQPISTTVEEEKDIAVPAEELDKYFFSSLINSASSPIFKHLEAVHEQLNRTFPTNLVAFTQLQKSLLRVPKSINASVALEVKEAYQQLAVKLEMLAFNYKVYKEHRSFRLKSLNRLSKLRSQKDNLREQFHTVDLNQKMK